MNTQLSLTHQKQRITEMVVAFSLIGKIYLKSWIHLYKPTLMYGIEKLCI